MSESTKVTLEACINTAREASTIDEIKSALEDINSAMHQAAQEMYNNTAENTENSVNDADINPESGFSDDSEEDVIDAEFEETA